MPALLAYEDPEEQTVFRNDTITFATARVRISAATMAGTADKPNEDTFAVTKIGSSLYAAIFDGTSSQKPIAALKGQTGARFASHFLKTALNNQRRNVKLNHLLLSFNKRLLAATKRLGGSLTDTHTLPASSATLIKLDTVNNQLSFAQVSDSFAIGYYKDGSSRVLTRDTNKPFDDRMFALFKNIAKEQGITPREARLDERSKSALMQIFIEKNNNPNGKGSGVVNGDPNIQRYLEYEELPTGDITAVLLGSDGLIPPGWALSEQATRQELLNIIQEGGFAAMFAKTKAIQDADPDWHYMRFKHSDDATGILIELI